MFRSISDNGATLAPGVRLSCIAFTAPVVNEHVARWHGAWQRGRQGGAERASETAPGQDEPRSGRRKTSRSGSTVGTATTCVVSGQWSVESAVARAKAQCSLLARAVPRVR